MQLSEEDTQDDRETSQKVEDIDKQNRKKKDELGEGWREINKDALW